MSNILVVEDEANVRKLVAVNLISRGYRVYEAQDVQQALGWLHAQPLDLIVLDIKLPDLTGWDLLAKIDADAALEFSGPVLVMTASIMDAQADLDRYPLVVEVLVKPFSAAKLVAATERALQLTLPHRT
ncbi:MAG TPA: response regulator [Anaerolineae bacterium]|nr:response regulator [Anaerolineae bacterium]